jgi:benzoyl-CoA reductase/2-hydroxyglutaryl-CoA dehydratase subunit BcrC/BadD/HgdB
LDTKITSKAFDRFSEAAGTVINPEIEKWKDQGGRVVGYFCSAMPTEMITAAGLFPFRLRATGSTGTELSDSFFGTINCSFPRHAFNMALKGEYDFLDGLVVFNSCDHIRRVYDHWIRQIKTPFVKILSLPKKAEAPQVEFFRGELANLRDDMQTHFDVEITDDKLKEAIRLHNETRHLLQTVYELRKGKNPPITGAETMAVTVASTALPLKQFNRLLQEFLEDLKNAEGHADYRARLMLLGGELDNPEYIKVIEDQGALVVTDSLCFGSRILWGDVDENTDDPLMALAQYYVADRPSCARMYTEYEKRTRYVRDMIKEFKADGAIFERLTFCELWGFEQFSMTNDFKEWNVPLLCMDREYILSGVGQLKTRVQAFLEAMGR